MPLIVASMFCLQRSRAAHALRSDKLFWTAADLDERANLNNMIGYIFAKSKEIHSPNSG